MTMPPQIKLIIRLLIIIEIWASAAMSRPSMSDDAIVAAKHEEWMVHHSQTYKSSSEKQKRFQIFKTNLEYIESFNNAPNKTYKLSLNKFSDLNNEEFLAAYTGFKMPTADVPATNYTATAEMQDEVPDNIDWREYEGVVTPIQYQGHCGCCWAFSAVTAVEGIVRNGVPLSAQQLLDCVTEGNGCGGGNMKDAFEYIIQNQGITSETEYPYQQMQGSCRASSNNLAQITAYVNVEPNNEEALKIAVANQPVSVGLNASPSFKSYSSGIFSGDDCDSDQLNHAVAIVGYGEDAEGTKYWIIKNQWGESWGSHGYMMMLRDAEVMGGVCGIAKFASYPTV